ncbi:hypothetical protein QEN42_10970 [Gordonia alkanivorans]|uniref:divisome protein SepX/GlpR n=1 Tax=Gordonia alkanivorans TaxID=84096 RepID=UPI002446972D|nr:gephyrin-like molybdotransferase receptor GlpR [Gordonia alkanivorans]MDH3050391.1 hypothetical protein [Gordonia alkanivorans]
MPNSVLWVCLVAVWLFVLVPMVIKGRPQILKSTEAAKKTRLLHRGGSRATAPSTARRRSSARHPHDPSWKSSRTATATAVVDEVEDDTETETEDTDVTTKVQRVADVEAEKPTVEATDDTEDVADDEADDVTDDVEDDETAEADDDLTDEAEDLEVEDSEEAEYEDDSEVAEYDDGAEYEDAEHEDAEYEDAEYEDSETDEYEDATDDLDEDEYDDYARASRHTEAEPEAVVDEVEDDRPAARKPQPERGRRNVYSSEKERELKYRERQRVTLGLFALLILALVSGFLIGTTGWVATGLVGLMLVGYLAYLRRAVKVEQQIRAQRLARAKRAQRAEEERRRRAAAVPEFAAAPPPPRLRRPGGAVVLEIDDEDPVFEHLPPFQRRRMDREDLEFRRVG